MNSANKTANKSSSRTFKPLCQALLLAGLGLASVGAAAEEGAIPAIKGVVNAGTPLQLVKDGFNGTEGPLALADGSLVFTETQGNRITRIAADGSTSTFLEESNGSNGLAVDGHGDIVAVQVLDPKVGVVYPKEHAKSYFSAYEGTAFGRPNDIVISHAGHIYFTDSGQVKSADPAVVVPPRPAVYHITPDGSLQRIANDIERPNGIQLSPDEKILYVANTDGEFILAYDVAKDGSVSGRRNFAKLDGITRSEKGLSSGADGLAVDAKGRLYVASNTGIQVFSAAGESLGTIPLPKKPQNLAFAGPGKKTLYVVGRGAVYKLAVLTPGYAGRSK